MGLTTLINQCFQVLLLIGTIISVAQCQKPRPNENDCHKYCFADCAKYLESNETRLMPVIWGMSASSRSGNLEVTECVNAKLTCVCRSLFSWKNPWLILSMVIFLILLLYLIYRIHRKCKKDRYVHHNHHQWSSSNAIFSYPAVPPNTISNGNYGMTNAGYQTSSPDVPPDYLPPPPYDECVNNNNNNSKPASR